MNRLTLVYSLTENVLFCFWKYYLQACGFWVSERCIETDDIQNMGERTLYLYNYSFAPDVMARPIDKRKFYIIYSRNGKKEDIKKFHHRKDCIYFRNWYKPPWNQFKNAVLWFLEDEQEEAKALCSLMDNFTKNKLWKALWLAQEVISSGEIQKRWNEEITRICYLTIENVKNWQCYHSRYMSLYCEYVVNLINARSLVLEENAVFQLLLKCKELLDFREVESRTVIDIFMAKICSSSRLYGSLSIQYYENVLKNEKNGKLLYSMGYAYEKKCGDWNKAITYYKQAELYDKNCYKARYKLANQAELERRWLDAYEYYEQIEEYLLNQMQYDQISVENIEYLYKTWNRLMIINRDVAYNSRNSMIYENKIYKLYSLVLDKHQKGFGKLVHCMDLEDRKGLLNDDIIASIKSKFINMKSEVQGDSEV